METTIVATITQDEKLAINVWDEGECIQIQYYLDFVPVNKSALPQLIEVLKSLTVTTNPND